MLVSAPFDAHDGPEMEPLVVRSCANLNGQDGDEAPRR